MGAMIQQHYRGRDIQKIFGISSSTMYEWIQRGLLPKPIKMSRTSLWIRSEIQQVIESKMIERDEQ